jgi:hypothetical protein
LSAEAVLFVDVDDGPCHAGFKGEPDVLGETVVSPYLNDDTDRADARSVECCMELDVLPVAKEQMPTGESSNRGESVNVSEKTVVCSETFKESRESERLAVDAEPVKVDTVFNDSTGHSKLKSKEKLESHAFWSWFSWVLVPLFSMPLMRRKLRF